MLYSSCFAWDLQLTIQAQLNVWSERVLNCTLKISGPNCFKALRCNLDRFDNKKIALQTFFSSRHDVRKVTRLNFPEKKESEVSNSPKNFNVTCPLKKRSVRLTMQPILTEFRNEMLLIFSEN